MSLTCELSGEPIATTQQEVVATPSGHICIKRLLLQKLAENGGLDPFETFQDRPLSEDQLIVLKVHRRPTTTSTTTSSSSSAGVPPPPPRPQVSSLPNLLHLVQSEYDALVLELFDTRKALEDTRRELSQALYQNDAAVRVVARLAMERDAARQQLEQWNASVGSNHHHLNNNNNANTATVQENDAEPQSKRQKVATSDDTPTGILVNDLPESVVQLMTETWQALHPKRKPMLKAAAAKAPTPNDIVHALTSKDATKTISWHKTSCRSVMAISTNETIIPMDNDNNEEELIVTIGDDKQIVVYSATNQVVKHSLSMGGNRGANSIPTCVHLWESLVVAGDGTGRVVVFSTKDGSTMAQLQIPPSKANQQSTSTTTTSPVSIVDVKIHPTLQHVCVTTADGRVIICSLSTTTSSTSGGATLTAVAEFQKSSEDGTVTTSTTSYTCGAIHPDGLLFAAGTSKGEIHMWDFKNKVLASTMKEGDTDTDAVTTIAFSNNGYHLATGHAQSAVVRFWDLRKQRTIATLNVMENTTDAPPSSSPPLLSSISSIVFDKSGKYAAYGGKGGVQVTTIKEWGITAASVPQKENEEEESISGVAWTLSGLASCSDKRRAVSLYGGNKSNAEPMSST